MLYTHFGKTKQNETWISVAYDTENSPKQENK